MKPKAMLSTLAALVLACGCACAQASVVTSKADTSVLTSESLLLQQSEASTITLAVPGSGELFVTLSDLDFPSPFASLQYAVSDANGTLIPLTNAGTMMTLDLTAPSTLYADVFATLDGSAGLYNLTATFVSTSAVPLPGSALSMTGGGMLLILLALCADSFAQARSRTEKHAIVTTPVA